MDPAAAVKWEMRFFRKKNQPGGGPSGGSPSDREIPRPPHAPLPPIPAGRGLPGPVASARAGVGPGWLHNGSGGGRRGQNALSPKISRCATRGERGKPLLRARREGRLCAGPGRLYAPSRRIRGGSNGGPAARIAFFPVPDAGDAAARGPPFPRPGNSPCAPNAFAAPAETQGAERAGGLECGCGSNGRRGRRPRPSGCGRPRLRVLMRMRGTRHARYLQTPPQPYSYAEYATAAIIRRYSLLQPI